MMRQFLLLQVLLIFMSLVSTSALGWEFTVKGEYENRFRWFGRTADRDLSGEVSAQQQPAGGVLVGFAGPNIYNTGALPTVPAPTSNLRLNLGNAVGRQMLITRGGFSSAGPDALYNDSRFTLKPTFKVNNAISVRGIYNVGWIRNKYS